jgi:predicted MPP superfamily phosphohydrolase
MNRREFLKRSAFALAASGAATGIYAWRIEPHWLEIVRRPMAISGLPPDLEGRTLALITDIHIGIRVDDDYVRRAFERARALAPDFVAYVGDFVSWDGADTLDKLKMHLPEAPRGRIATVGSLGNHEYGADWRHPERALEITRILLDAGVHVLRNDSTIVAGLQFVGLDDLWGRQFDAERAFRSADPRVATVALSHNPDTVDLPEWGGFQGWILAGHTHGGQVKPPFLPPPILPVANRRYTSGEIDLVRGRKLYISRGVGHLTRVRFNVRPEITLFHLGRT